MIETTHDMSIFALIFQASVPVQIIILLLVLISVVSWAFIFDKFRTLKEADMQARRFEQDFWSGGDLSILQQSISRQREAHGALARIFDIGMAEFIKGREKKIGHELSSALDSTRRAMNAAYQREIDALELRLNFLASAGSVSPYIGLLGTVWGIMHAFIGLTQVQQATLVSVAPGIAEALIATAIGLFAAIPAVLAYNRFTYTIDRLSVRFESFMDEFLNILQRQGS